MRLHMRRTIQNGEPVRLDGSVPIERSIEGRTDVISAAPFHADLTAYPTMDGLVEVRGTLSGHLDMVCSRCLEPAHIKLDIPFDERFKEREEGEADLEDDEDMILASVDEVLLTPYLEEYVTLGVPNSPLCKKDCKGLCQTCGTNLNETACGCDNTVIDPRLAGLKDFFK
ncbi:YceD family protein [Saccharibacillus kuerlensis]|uniref:DUF177 domain-containing protein n=1 Tax=Saccharibacillus kuerlensis TaxID=459527 RepID=A0ABQ2KQW1_9BACL|nr:DUF177 domain-containing protein [Saccharibacillus kuerlensis]GGN90671.1 hypothetical protein GCM10010969_01420 [Saccharibacillus kuerlensis]